MKCPVALGRCRKWKPVQFGIDVCREGCGGVWFDKNELQVCDEASELFPRELLCWSSSRLGNRTVQAALLPCSA